MPQRTPQVVGDLLGQDVWLSEQECLERAGELEQQLTELASTSPLRPEPDHERVERRVLAAYQRCWGIGT